MTVDDDLYAVLEVAPHARAEVIHAAFAALRELSACDATSAGVGMLVRLNRAHAVLGHPERRAAYDLDRSP